MADHGGVTHSSVVVHEALSAILRWGSRPDVHKSLTSGPGAGLSSTDVWLLSAVHDHGPLRMRDLAAWQGVDKSTVSTQIRRLEQRDLITRAPDPTDGRATLLSVTATGRTLSEGLTRTGADAVDGVLSAWTPDDRHRLAELLGRLSAALTQAPQPPDRGRAGYHRPESTGPDPAAPSPAGPGPV
ncbi:hypothetical protein GCM10009818_22690 [Nakamurella flavida]|nr:MarR family winged helix-turn-helix transcriptional regulator [Nakamurella flavida]